MSAFEYCIEMRYVCVFITSLPSLLLSNVVRTNIIRSPVNFAENCPGTGLPQDYFFRSDGSGDKSGRDRNNSKPSTQWCQPDSRIQTHCRSQDWVGRRLALSSSIVGLIFATIGAIFVFVFACVAHDDEDFSFGFFALCSVVSWVILYVICMVRTLTVLEDAWPKNGCYIAICTRHGDDDFGTAKTSLSPSDLREAWEGGTDRMFDAMALVVVVFLYVMLTALIRWCGEFVRAKSNHDITREAEARQNARRVVSYQSEPEVFVGRAELPPPPPEAPPPPYSTANYDPPVGLLDEFVVHQGPAVAGSDGKFYDEPEPQRNRSTCV